ncbi:DNA-binding response regulator, OmpR family, contains REC and winged-helix (wHTH) domain [Actinokineospora terrae]|uniref:DNA-binding response regulator, OmpR family, contains REC and winged-helix (WHTH) domain n=1 Tax=Actinokineospora terrae TaxID=155974 RepID=A0A1H9KYA0_9PSEU|nr:DNA-binding response regulator, OmpR family, contains REC and winged-helix (wHTH) domain [Actinokineospora terrae]
MLGGGPRVLVVADCDGAEETVVDLRRHGFEPVAVTTGAAAMAAHREVDVVLVDLDLADFDGLTLCRELRATSDVPMIGFASFSELERVLALEAGCDDCVEKPYRSRELVARLGALLRRARVLSPPTITAGELRIHPTLREVRVGDRVVETTRKEFELLLLLASECERLFSRAELLRRVWEYDSVDAEITALASRTIDTHVSSLRKKLGSPHWIVTVRGVGFRFTDDARADPDSTDSAVDSTDSAAELDEAASANQV